MTLFCNEASMLVMIWRRACLILSCDRICPAQALVNNEIQETKSETLCNRNLTVKTEFISYGF